MKVAWVTDSTVYLDEDTIQKWGIHRVPIRILMDGKDYGEEDDLSTVAFFERLPETEAPPTTSQPPAGHFATLFEELKKDYDMAIAVHISDKLSGTCQSCRMGAELANFQVEIIDSEILAFPMAQILLDGIRLYREGASVDDVLKYMNRAKKNTGAALLVGSLDRLYRSGRLNGAQYWLGQMLQVKPILSFEDGRLVAHEKVRTLKRGYSRLNEIAQEVVDRSSKELRLCVVHTHAPQEANAWVNELSQRFPHISIAASSLGPSIGVHSGQGTLGLAWYDPPPTTK